MGFLYSISSSKFLALFLLASVAATCLGSQDLSSQPQQCIHHHFSALLRLKHGFRFSNYSNNLSSWNPQNRDCCAWEGIKCDTKTGHVITLDISQFYISGQIDFESLSHLRSLQILNLAANSFDPSPIASAIGQLSNLTHLNFSYGNFYGQIPLEMSSLINLVSLDLSDNGGLNVADTDSPYLKLEKPGIGALIQNLSSLRELCLDFVEMSSGGRDWSQAISSALPNLRKLSMFSCGLSGPIHPSLFQLHFLIQLDLGSNNFSPSDFDFIGNLSSLTSILRLSRLSELDLSENDLPSSVPDFIGNLSSLTSLRLTYCGLHGRFPSRILRLPYLTELDLSYNNFSSTEVDFSGNLSSLESLTELNLQACNMSGPLPSWIGNFAKLESLDLADNYWYGPIPSSLLSLPSLRSLNLENNQLGGLVEFHNASFSLLENIHLHNNKLQGRIPRSMFQLRNLLEISLHLNNFTDDLDLGLFKNLTKLSELTLSNINLLVEDGDSNSTSMSFPQLYLLHLQSCNIKRFPDFLRNQEKLGYLDLSNNKLEGEIPTWIWKVVNGGLSYLNLSHNALHVIEAPIPHLSSTRLEVLDLSSNILEGSLPIPSSFLLDYLVSNNSLSGEIPMSICNLTQLRTLDISGNRFTGSIPQCFGEMSDVLRVLNLRKNSFNGSLLQTFKKNCSLEMLDLSENKLEGQLPTSLAHCKRLVILNLRSNQIRDTFPLWVQDLANLRILALRSNNFYGPIEILPTAHNFSSELQIVDLSFNSFNGCLSSAMFWGWKVMAGEDNSEQEYLRTFHSITYSSFGPSFSYEEIMITSKRLEMDLKKILSAFTAVDLSNNHFQGQIPESIGILKSLRVLNMSHNGFTGPIPKSLKNLTLLESLDLSENNISGHIPQELSELTFLSVLNLSKNQLAGSIPHAKQFLTFTNDSFQDNLGLCGPPLSQACEDFNGAPTSTFQDPELLSEGEYDWKMIAIGFGIGYGVGMGAFCWALVLWAKGRRAYNKFAYKMLLLICPSAM